MTVCCVTIMFAVAGAGFIGNFPVSSASAIQAPSPLNKKKMCIAYQKVGAARMLISRVAPTRKQDRRVYFSAYG